MPDETAPADGLQSFISVILEPGSSLHPTFLLALDVVLGALFLLLLGLLIASRSLHFLALLSIETALWVTLKW